MWIVQLPNWCQRHNRQTSAGVIDTIKAGIGPTWVLWIKHNFGYIRPTLPFPHISLSIASRILISHNNFCNFDTSECYQHNINILFAWKRINIHILFYSFLFYSIPVTNDRWCYRRRSSVSSYGYLTLANSYIKGNRTALNVQLSIASVNETDKGPTVMLKI